MQQITRMKTCWLIYKLIKTSNFCQWCWAHLAMDRFNSVYYATSLLGLCKFCFNLHQIIIIHVIILYSWESDNKNYHPEENDYQTLSLCFASIYNHNSQWSFLPSHSLECKILSWTKADSNLQISESTSTRAEQGFLDTQKQSKLIPNVMKHDKNPQQRLRSVCTSAVCSVFIVCMKKLYILGYPKCAQWKLWSDCTNAPRL